MILKNIWGVVVVHQIMLNLRYVLNIYLKHRGYNEGKFFVNKELLNTEESESIEKIMSYFNTEVKVFLDVCEKIPFNLFLRVDLSMSLMCMILLIIIT